MKFDYKALIRLMKKSYKGGGIKIIPVSYTHLTLPTNSLV